MENPSARVGRRRTEVRVWKWKTRLRGLALKLMSSPRKDVGLKSTPEMKYPPARVGIHSDNGSTYFEFAEADFSLYVNSRFLNIHERIGVLA